MLAELPRLTDEERWELIDRAMELEDFSEGELKLIDERIEAHKRNPGSSVPLDQMVTEIREEYGL